MNSQNLNSVSDSKTQNLSNSVKQSNYTLIVSLILSGDVETNPGPPEGSLSANADSVSNLASSNIVNSQNNATSQSTAYLCGTCKEPVTWEDKGVMCEECEIWYHTDCQNISDNSYEKLDNSNVVWTCLVCDAPNYSSILFDLHNIESENRFSVLNNSSFGIGEASFNSVDSQQDLGHPKAASSPVKPKPKRSSGPRPLRIVNINCQSLTKKKGPFYNILDSTKPDIIILTETWFKNNISNAEYFNSQYTVHRRDRNAATDGGGVIVAVNSDFISTREESLETDSSEAVWIKINIRGCKSLYVGGCYRPRENDEVAIEDLDAALSKIFKRSNNNIVLVRTSSAAILTFPDGIGRPSR